MVTPDDARTKMEALACFWLTLGASSPLCDSLIPLIMGILGVQTWELRAEISPLESQRYRLHVGFTLQYQPHITISLLGRLIL